MITKKTVLVLGAGASEPYRFPIGRRLAAEIRGFADSSAAPNLCRNLRKCVRDAASEETVFLNDLPLRMKELGAALTKALPLSIDQFLELRSDVADAGRVAIAKSLLQAERASADPLWDENTDGHWYAFLRSKLICPIDMLRENQLRIITFNYDRSFEHYLCESLWPFYSNGTPEEKHYKVMTQIRILHVYGSLGPLPWQSPTSPVSYGADTDEEILTASMSIKILYEGTRDDVRRRFNTAQEWLDWADRIVFLGFGFHGDNVKRLDLPNTLKNKKTVTATCKGLDLTNKEAVQFCTGASRSQPSINFPNSTADCYTLLHDHVVLS